MLCQGAQWLCSISGSKALKQDENGAGVELQTCLHDLLASQEQEFQRLEDDLKQPWLDRSAGR